MTIHKAKGLKFDHVILPGLSKSPGRAKRLADLKATGVPVDANQTAVQYVEAFIPVVEAIAVFSFGQAEQKLIVDVTERLVKRAAEMREALMPSASGDDQKKKQQ